MSARFLLSLNQVVELNDLLASAAGIIRSAVLAALNHSDEVPERAPFDAAFHAAKLVDDALAIIHGASKLTGGAEAES